MTLRPRAFQYLVMTASILMTACSQESFVPLEIESSDMCTYCRMAISEKRYAAEFIDKQGEAYKFDDLECMRNHVQSKHIGQNDATWFVVDFESKQWLHGQQSSFVQSARFKTPMSGGMVALKDRTRAEQVASQTQGSVMSFAEVFGIAP